MDRRTLFTLAPLVGAALAFPGAPALASEGAPKASANSFVRFPTLTAIILRPDGRRGIMTVETGVDVVDATLRTRATQAQPRLRAAYNAVVQQMATGLRPGAVPDIEQLSRDLQTATNATLGRHGATLLLGTVMVV